MQCTFLIRILLWHHKQFVVYAMETVVGQMKKSRILDFVRFLRYGTCLQIFHSTLTLFYDWMDNIFQRRPQVIEPWELIIKFSDVGGPSMVGSDAKEKFLKVYLLERLKKHPRTNF